MTADNRRHPDRKAAKRLQDACNVFDIFNRRDGAASEAIAADAKAAALPAMLGPKALCALLPEPPAAFGDPAAELTRAFGDDWRSLFLAWDEHAPERQAKLAAALVASKDFIAEREAVGMKKSATKPAARPTPKTQAPAPVAVPKASGGRVAVLVARIHTAAAVIAANPMHGATELEGLRDARRGLEAATPREANVLCAFDRIAAQAAGSTNPCAAAVAIRQLASLFTK